MKISNWGNYPVIDAKLSNFSSLEEAQRIVQNAEQLIPRGLGRCYGDSALNDSIISTLKFNRILTFDEQSGTVTCESGVSLAEILDVFVPRGWFLPVTPGTKFVTVGGAIASDVHGKNHHLAGSFSNHVLSFDLLMSDGRVQTCTKEETPDLFWSTCGGMGLTGLILKATFRLAPISSVYIRQETVKCKNIDAIMDVFEQSQEWTFSVAWIDCLARGESLGRSIMMRGEFAEPDEVSHPKARQNPLRVPAKFKKTVPINFPNLALNTLSIRAFNALFYGKAPSGTAKSVIDYDTFFYPLDSIHHWNRIYGKRGFTQYQFVLPVENSRQGMKDILNKIANSGQGSFLAVLKLFGKQDDLISFPREGYTLALDFPISPRLFPLLDELDRMVINYGGRIYLTKDVRMSERVFKESYENVEKFLTLKRQADPVQKFQSYQSKRLGIL